VEVLDTSSGYFLEHPPSATAYLGTFAVVVVLAAIGVAGAYGYRRAQEHPPAKRALEVAFFVGLAFAVQGARVQLEDRAGMAVEMLRNLTLGFAILPANLRTKFRHALATILLVASPFAAITAGQVLWKTARAASGADAPLFAVKPPAPLVPTRSGPRVVVLVMDELDQFLAFDDRPAGLALPVLDAFAASSFHGTRAQPPAMLTERAVPSLLTGRRVVSTGDAGPSDHRLVFDDRSSALFSETETFLETATRSGRNVSLVGWYHPYCRIFGDSVASCSGRPYAPPDAKGLGFAEGLGFFDVFRRQTSALLANWPMAAFGLLKIGALMDGASREQWHIETWQLIQERARAHVGDPRFDLVFVHYPLPHLPGIWNLETQKLDGDKGTYEGNMALADASLGELLAAIDAGPRASETFVVIVSDHGKRVFVKNWLPSPRLRDGEPRPIPFLVRVPGGAGLAYDTPFEATRVHALVPALLDGQVTSSDAVRDWVAR